MRRPSQLSLILLVTWSLFILLSVAQPVKDSAQKGVRNAGNH
jgi:hypothetical protein